MSDFTIITSDNPRDEEPLAIIADIETGMKKTEVIRKGIDMVYNELKKE